MKYYHALYMSDELVQKKAEIIEKIEKDKWQMEKYLIVLAKNEKNHLEYFHSVLLLQKSIAKDYLFVIGIANGELGAMELIEKITQEVYDETKGTDIRGFILQKQKEYEERYYSVWCRWTRHIVDSHHNRRSCYQGRHQS